MHTHTSTHTRGKVTWHHMTSHITLHTTTTSLYSHWLQDFPLGVVGSADRSIICTNLDPQPQMARKVEMQLKYQYHSLTIFKPSSAFLTLTLTLTQQGTRIMHPRPWQLRGKRFYCRISSLSIHFHPHYIHITGWSKGPGEWVYPRVKTLKRMMYVYNQGSLHNKQGSNRIEALCVTWKLVFLRYYCAGHSRQWDSRLVDWPQQGWGWFD